MRRWCVRKASEYGVAVSLFLQMHTSEEITELLAMEMIDNEDKIKATREAELEARAKTSNNNLKSRRGR